MSNDCDLRDGEAALALPENADAELYFIGRLRTPWADRDACPKQGDPVAGPLCRIEVFEPFAEAVAGIEANARLQVLYWMHLARRDLVRQRRRASRQAYGTFALRSPARFNPVAVTSVSLVGIEGVILLVRGLDCVDGTPLIDIKPEYCPAVRGSGSDGQR